MEILEAQWGIFYTSIRPIICLTVRGRVARFAFPYCLHTFFSSSTPEGSPGTLTPTTPSPPPSHTYPKWGGGKGGSVFTTPLLVCPGKTGMATLHSTAGSIISLSLGENASHAHSNSQHYSFSEMCISERNEDDKRPREANFFFLLLI